MTKRSDPGNSDSNLDDCEGIPQDTWSSYLGEWSAPESWVLSFKGKRCGWEVGGKNCKDIVEEKLEQYTR